MLKPGDFYKFETEWFQVWGEVLTENTVREIVWFKADLSAFDLKLPFRNKNRQKISREEFEKKKLEYIFAKIL